MNEEQIKQNAEQYAEEHMVRTDGGGWEEEYDYEEQKAAYIAGAHSRDEEIKELKERIQILEERACDVCINKMRYDKELDQLRNPWISVKDKLPQLNKICFGMRDGKMPRICMLVKKKNGECVFNTPNEEYEYPKGKITHWMPIPELKKGE